MKHTNGFSLLEMIVAIGIFSVIATIGYASLNRFLDEQDEIALRIDHLRQLQSAFSIIEQDMHFLTARSVRDGYGDVEPALFIDALQSVPGELLRITTSQVSTSASGLSIPTRVAYRIESNRLYRVSWQVLDRDQDSKETIRRLADNLEDVSIALLLLEDDSVNAQTSWGYQERLPDGIEWRFTSSDGRTYRRIFEVRHAP